MIEFQSLEQIIRKYVSLSNHPSSKGWYSINCEVCHDHGKKGERGGFRFTDPGKIEYHCFNCGIYSTFDPFEHNKIPTSMENVLHSFNIPESEWQQVLFQQLKTKDRIGSSAFKKQTTHLNNITPKQIFQPPTFYYLKDALPNNKWAEIARWYLKEQRSIDPTSYPFMLSHNTDDIKFKKWNSRLIVPIFKDDKLIYYFGRDLTNKKPKKYLNPTTEKEKILYGFDKLFKDYNKPLYVTEGWFDGYVIDGIAILGNSISETQIEWLNKSKRPKVYIPDKFGDGEKAGHKALSLGWSISTPDIGNHKDMNAAVHKYGKLYVIQSLIENTAQGFEAKTKLGIFCK